MTVHRMVTTFPWHVWPGRHWPLTASEEVAFVTELREHAGGRDNSYDRGDTTALLNAIRCGVTIETVLQHAPGVRAARLLAAYEDLEDRRSHSEDAWWELIDDPHTSAFSHLTPIASRIIPIPVYRLVTASGRHLEHAQDPTADRVIHEMKRATAAALVVEEQLVGLPPSSIKGVRLGRELYDPYVPSLWGDPFYLPVRVGSLMPVKVADLLLERPR